MSQASSEIIAASVSGKNSISSPVYELPLPRFFDPQLVKDVWKVPYQERETMAIDWRRKYALKPAAEDALKIALMPIDVQNTFCLPDFELFVRGASGMGPIEDNTRLCEFIYRNLGVITRIHPTLDTHTAAQIFHPTFWVDDSGSHPVPMTVISLLDVESGKWRVNPAMAYSVLGDSSKYVALERHGLHYVRKLSQGGKYPLMIWPFHAMLGGIGHALVSAVEEAIFFHSIARDSQTDFQIKGGCPLTENYSVLAPEVLEDPDGRSIARRNVKLIKALMDNDMVIIAGQAKSHCVAWTIQDLLDWIAESDKALARKVYLLDDCTSPVVVPGVIDFTEQANAAFDRFKAAGMHVVRSTDPIDSWPEVGSIIR